MAKYKYAADYNEDTQARAVGLDLGISVKHAVNVCNMIRSKPLARAKKMLEEVIAMERAVPYRRFKKDLSHRKGDMTAGRYPVRVTKEMLTVIKSVEANAVNKGLNPSNLVIRSISAHKASNQWHYGRHRRRLMKRGHLEIVLEEASADEKAAKKGKSAAAPVAAKTESSKESAPKADTGAAKEKSTKTKSHGDKK